MAHANNSIIVGKLQGGLGKELVFRDWEGKTVVAKAPKKRKGGPTSAQAETIDRFQDASIYATGITKGDNEDLKEAYSAILKPRQNLYSRALEDFMKPPVVKTITTREYNGAAGSKLTIRAKDDFRVTKVFVEIYSAAGALLEQGSAVITPNIVDWNYTATQANPLLAGSKIKATATDVPGNEGMLEITL